MGSCVQTLNEGGNTSSSTATVPNTSKCGHQNIQNIVIGNLSNNNSCDEVNKSIEKTNPKKDISTKFEVGEHIRLSSCEQEKLLNTGVDCSEPLVLYNIKYPLIKESEGTQFSGEKLIEEIEVDSVLSLELDEQDNYAPYEEQSKFPEEVILGGLLGRSSAKLPSSIRSGVNALKDTVQATKALQQLSNITQTKKTCWSGPLSSSFSNSIPTNKQGQKSLDKPNALLVQTSSKESTYQKSKKDRITKQNNNKKSPASETNERHFSSDICSVKAESNFSSKNLDKSLIDEAQQLSLHEGMMELKRQMVPTRHDVQVSRFSRSLSTGNAPPNVCQSTADAVVQRNISPSEHAPGSPYRTTSSTGLYLSTSDSVATGGARSYLNNSTASGLNGYTSGVPVSSAKHSLSKELMQKLRSMTETIKMLSDENEMLKRENDRIRDEEEGVYTVVKHEVGKVGGSQGVNKSSTFTRKTSANKTARGGEGGYEDMNKTELVSLTKAYDQKVKALSEEIVSLQKEVNRQSREDPQKMENSKDNDEDKDKRQIYATGEKNDTGASKDKYKTLARRLKEERNQYRETCEEKQKEQDELKGEMEKMSELIGEL